jgi:membrane protease YdiL (CAAX protease family)
MSKTMKNNPSQRLSFLPAFVVFWVLAAAISWVAYPLADPAAVDSFAGRIADPFGTLAKFGPSIAGIICVVLFAGPRGLGDLFRSLFDVKRPVAIIAVLALPFVATAAGIAAEAMISDAQFLGSTAPLSIGLLAGALYWIGLKFLLGGGLGEELGIRGFLLPRMLTSMGPRLTSLIIGIAWWLWHAPVLVSAEPIVWIAQLLLTVSLSVIFTFIFLRTNGSVGIAVLLHAAINGWAGFAENAWAPLLDDASIWQIVRILVFVLIAIILCFIRWKKRDETASPEV